MKKKNLVLSIAFCMGVSSLSIFASELPDKPMLISEKVVSIPQINMQSNITRAEFIIPIVQTITVDLPEIMDTHYALPAMQKAEELGLIDLDMYPMDTWSDIMPNEEKSEILTKAMQNKNIDIEKVHAALDLVLANKVSLDGHAIDLCNLSPTQYNGKLMLPVRPIAEAMGFKVTWDAKTYTATLNNGKIKSNIQVGFDSYHYSSVNAIGMSAPFSVGATPLFIDGKIYAPYECFLMFADGEVLDNAVNFTMK